jgi:Ca2+/Na+ antiporter
MKLFPPVAVVFTFLYVLGIAGTSDRDLTNGNTFTTTIIVTLIFTIMTLLYFIAELKEGRKR